MIPRLSQNSLKALRRVQEFSSQGCPVTHRGWCERVCKRSVPEVARALQRRSTAPLTFPCRVVLEAPGAFQQRLMVFPRVPCRVAPELHGAFHERARALWECRRASQRRLSASRRHSGSSRSIPETSQCLPEAFQNSVERPGDAPERHEQLEIVHRRRGSTQKSLKLRL